MLLFCRRTSRSKSVPQDQESQACSVSRIDMCASHAYADVLHAGVCRSVRAETRSIYYSENSFELLVRNYNGAAFVPFARQFWPFSCRLGLTNVTFQLTGMPIWKNLVEWVKADRYYFFDLIPELSSRREDHLDHVLAGLFKLANALRGSSWHTVEQALAAMRLSLMGTCAAFWIDEGYDEESDW